MCRRRCEVQHGVHACLYPVGGLCFGTVMVMHRAAVQVATALAAFQPAWNFTLFFVMGGALAVAAPMYQLLIKNRQTALDGESLSLPTSRRIDWQLLTGGALFGAGWGLGGMCPGPAIVVLASGQQQGIALVVAMLAGMVAGQQVQRQCELPKKNAASAGSS